MEWADLLIIITWIGLLLGPLVVFIWRIYRRGFWAVIKDDPKFLERVQRAWKQRSERRGDTTLMMRGELLEEHDAELNRLGRRISWGAFLLGIVLAMLYVLIRERP